MIVTNCGVSFMWLSVKAALNYYTSKAITDYTNLLRPDSSLIIAGPIVISFHYIADLNPFETISVLNEHELDYFTGSKK